MQQTRQRIVRRHYSELNLAAQRAQVCPQTYAPAKHFVNRCWNIRGHADPANARAPRLFRHRSAHHHLPEKIGKIYPRAAAQRRPCPKPWIDIQEFVASITSITLVLNFNKSGVPDGSEQPPRRSHNLRDVECFYEGTGIAKVDRVLSRPACGERGNRLSVAAERRI